MKAHSSILSIFVAASLSCAAADEATHRASGGSLNTAGAGGTGLGTATGGAGQSTGGGGSAIISGRDSGSTTDPGSCGEHHFNLVRKPAEILLLLDRTLSMLDSPVTNELAPVGQRKWDAVVPAVQEALTQTDSLVSWGLKLFCETDTQACIQGSVTSKIDVPVAAMNAGKVIAAVPVTATGSGTPTGDAVNVVAQYLQTLQDDNPKYILLATDGLPSCTNGTLTRTTTESTTAAKPDAIAAISAAAAMGFHTFVVGIGASDSQTATLNEMALAGREPRADPNPLATRFYLATTKDELATALKLITGQVSTCVFTWSEPPPVPDNIAVKVGGVKAEHDPTNGWEYLGPDHLGVEVRGSRCDEIKTSAANMVEIIFGCPGVEIR